MSNANGKRALEDLDSTPGNSKRLNMDTDTDVVITHVSSQPQKGKINVSPSIARNPNKFFGAGSHKKNLQETIESISNEPRTPTRSPKSSQKRLSKFSPFKKSPSKSPRKELFPRAIEDQDSDTYLNFYDRTFEKVVLVSVIQMKEWQENNQLEDHLIDLNTLEKFCTLSQSAKTLYVRLVNRKHAWLKTNALEEKYGKNGADIVADLYTMKDAGVIENNYENEDLSDLLNLLQVHELKDFCKELKLSCSPRKAELVESILKFVKTQRSIMFGGDIQSRVKKLIKKYLGDCVKLSDEARDVFLSCVFLVTFPFYRELSDHVTRLNDYISRIVRTVRGEIKFPAVTLNRTCVFKNRRSFEQYMKAHELCTEIETACKLKSNQAVELLKTALDLLKADLNDETAMADIGNRPIYLRRYSSGYMYVKILYSKLNDIKRENRNLAVEVLTTLVNQNYFKEYEKGVWFESLAQVYQIQFKNNHKIAMSPRGVAVAYACGSDAHGGG
ncbi:hypothetical protein M8J76_007763 [Diaphorina citri]|nr:hypothetical protein M8J76_007763 [Diaphorina citri]